MNPKDKAQALQLLAKLQSGPAQEWLPNEEYFRQFDSTAAWAEECIEDDGSCPHAYFLFGCEYDSDKVIVQPVTFLDWPPPENKKYEAMKGLGIKFAQDHPEAMLTNIVHVSEAWMANYKPEEKIGDGPYLPKGVKTPSERPDRIEVITISALSIDQRFSVKHHEILRDSDEKFTGWGKELGTRYDPNTPPGDSRDNVDFLSVNVLMGYFLARRVSND